MQKQCNAFAVPILSVAIIGMRQMQERRGMWLTRMRKLPVVIARVSSLAIAATALNMAMPLCKCEPQAQMHQMRSEHLLPAFKTCPALQNREKGKCTFMYKTIPYVGKWG